MWRIIKDDRTSYLYGTVHMSTLEWIMPGPVTRDALIASESIALEMNILDPDTMTQLNLLLRQHAGDIPPQLRQRYEAAATAVCFPLAALDVLHPLASINNIMMLQARRDGYQAQYGADVVISEYAQSVHKPIFGLETPAIQARALLGTGAPTADTLDQALTSLESGQARHLAENIVEIWAKSDIDRMQHYREWCDCGENYAELITQRNAGLAAGIDAIHSKGNTVFAAVGAEHMMGVDGIPARLSRLGYQVEYIPPASRP